MKIDDIIISERQRKEIENDEYPIHELAASIRRTGGPVHKVVVDSEGRLIAGERRLTAIRLLHECYPEDNWDDVDVDKRGEIDNDKRELMELEENLHRKSLTPKEYNEALLRFHTKQSANNPQIMHGPANPLEPRWTAADTASALGRARTPVYDDIRVAEVMSLMSQEKRDEIYALGGNSRDGVARELQKVMDRADKNMRLKERQKKEESAEPSEEREEVRHIDALIGLGEMEDNSVDLIITDPPYGHLEGSAGSKGLGYATYTDRNFDDNEERTYTLLEKAIPELHRVLRPGSHIYLFCGLAFDRKVNFYTIAPMMKAAGFHVRSIPLIWSKPVQGYKPPFTHWPLNHEAILFATTGRRERAGEVPVSDVLSVKPIFGKNKVHRCEKPEELLQQLFDVSEESDGRFLDPFCGAGNHLLTARKNWMRVLGFDTDIQSVHDARDLLQKWDAEVLETNGAEQGMQMLDKVKKW